jgi:hypothetical protein
LLRLSIRVSKSPYYKKNDFHYIQSDRKEIEQGSLCSVNHCIFVLLSFGNCTLCPSICGFWLSLCNLQRFLPKYKYTLVKSLKTLYVIIYLTHMIRIRTWSLRNWFLLGSLMYTGNIGHTRHRTKTNEAERPHKHTHTHITTHNS